MPAEVIAGLVDALVLVIGLIVRYIWPGELSDLIMAIILALQAPVVALILYLLDQRQADRIARVERGVQAAMSLMQRDDTG